MPPTHRFRREMLSAGAPVDLVELILRLDAAGCIPPELRVEPGLILFPAAGVKPEVVPSLRTAGFIENIEGDWAWLKPQFRRFRLNRARDVSGVSGAGIVAEGVQFGDGTVVMRWLTTYSSTVIWPSLSAAMVVHGHDGATTVDWMD